MTDTKLNKRYYTMIGRYCIAGVRIGADKVYIASIGNGSLELLRRSALLERLVIRTKLKDIIL